MSKRPQPTNYLEMNTSDAKPFALYFSNFGYYCSAGPFETVEAAKQSGRAAGFDSAIYHRNGDLIAAYSVIGGWRNYSSAG